MCTWKADYLNFSLDVCYGNKSLWSPPLPKDVDCQSSAKPDDEQTPLIKDYSKIKRKFATINLESQQIGTWDMDYFNHHLLSLNTKG